MKSLYTLTILAATSLVFASCERTYTCNCYSPSQNQSTPSFKVEASTKSEAKNECQNQSGNYVGNDFICTLD